MKARENFAQSIATMFIFADKHARLIDTPTD
jgi:hypothetical protein